MADYIKLPKPFKTKWLNALRSGKYAQDREALRTSEGFCCLGVACDIHDKKIWVEDDGCFETKSGMTDWPGSKDLPDKVYKALKQNHQNDEETIMDFVAKLNDKGWTFKQIAAWIDRNL